MYLGPPKNADLRGVINSPPKNAWTLHRFEPRQEIEHGVSWIWAAAWNLGNTVHMQKTLPYPAANLVYEDGSLTLYGPSSALFERQLSGAGKAVGLVFRPGSARAVIDQPMAKLVDRAVPAKDFISNNSLVEKLTLPNTFDKHQIADILQDLVQPDLATQSESALLSRRAIELIVETPQLTKVDELSEKLVVGRRSLQRLFHDHVGLGVKATIKRFRLQDAAEQALSGRNINWSELANRLGYYDQSHLIGEFKATFGVPPQKLTKGRSAPANLDGY